MKKIIAIIISVLLTASTACAETTSYTQLQSASLYLYDSNMCGGDVEDKSLTDWRQNCHLCDAAVPLDTVHTDLSQDFINANKSILDKDGNGTLDLSGGYHDAGDYVKFGLPQMYTAVTLQWALYEYNQSFEANGDKAHIETILSRFTDYIKKCTFTDADGNVIAFCCQVGDGSLDHNYWGAPELQQTERKAFFATKYNPATDVTALASAALAADYVNTGSTDSLQYAKALYSFTNNTSIKAVGSDHSSNGEEFYNSTSYEDDIAFAAAWLYIATDDSTYLNTASTYLQQGVYDAPYWIYCWDDTWLGSIILIAEKTNNTAYWSTVKQTLDIWQNNYNTPEGYACIDNWGSARYNTNAQFIALLYSKYQNDNSYALWAKSQMEYLLGSNSSNKCYITGISANSVKYPHYAASSGTNDANDNSEHKYTLYGALVGGPDKNDYHIDKTGDYQYNEVAIDYNAGFVGACAGLNTLFGSISNN